MSDHDPDLVRNPHQIPERVRLIDLDRTWIASRNEVLTRIRDTDLDLYRLNTDAELPVYKLLDYGKFRFDQQKKTREHKKKMREQNRPIKEFKFKPSIDDHDISVKCHHIRDNLSQHDVKIFLELKRNAFVLTNRWSRSIADAVSDDNFVLKRVLAELRDIAETAKLTITDNIVFCILKKQDVEELLNQ